MWRERYGRYSSTIDERSSMEEKFKVGDTVLTPRRYLSWSEVSTWLHCQWAHRFHYAEGLSGKGPAGMDLQMGGAAHEILRAHFAVAPENRSSKALQKAAGKAYASLDMTADKYHYLRENQLYDYAGNIWKTWGADEEMSQMVVETPLEADAPSSDAGELRSYYCIPDGFHVDEISRVGTIVSHKTSLSKLPDNHSLLMFHPQARLEAWAMWEVFQVQYVAIYFNLLTPKEVERTGPWYYTEETHRRTTEDLKHMFTQVGRVDIIPRPSPQCWRCEYRKVHEDIGAGIPWGTAVQDWRDAVQQYKEAAYGEEGEYSW